MFRVMDMIARGAFGLFICLSWESNMVVLALSSCPGRLDVPNFIAALDATHAITGELT